jgi:hypothetical protein
MNRVSESQGDNPKIRDEPHNPILDTNLMEFFIAVVRRNTSDCIRTRKLFARCCFVLKVLARWKHHPGSAEVIGFWQTIVCHRVYMRWMLIGLGVDQGLSQILI